MRTEWIPTDEYYHRILDAPGVDDRRQLYLELMVDPWRAMMEMMSGAMPGSSEIIQGSGFFG